ncbi:hypothetical protein TRVL_09614 [Trypanosoma vivax]|nr:hypothetical protein TRVL_09614 [Trypanosoma vivax]
MLKQSLLNRHPGSQALNKENTYITYMHTHTRNETARKETSTSPLVRMRRLKCLAALVTHPNMLREQQGPAAKRFTALLFAPILDLKLVRFELTKMENFHRSCLNSSR